MKQARAQSSPAEQDAISILVEDHKKVKKMFMQFDKLMSSADMDVEKGALVEKICEELTIHSEIEEEIFYPAVRAAISDDDLMDEADVEHAGARELIAQLQEMRPGDDHYDAKVTVLGENIDHHVKEEQDDMFPKANKAGLDLADLGARMLERRQQLRESGGLSPPRKSSRAA